TRTSADALMKFAAQGGYGLVLCEEAGNAAPTAWVFAADTVLELEIHGRERRLQVRKHRFGPSVSGFQDLDLNARPPAVFPEPEAWMGRYPRESLLSQGWEVDRKSNATDLIVREEVTGAKSPPLRGAFVVINGGEPNVVRRFAACLVPEANNGRDLV